MPVVNFDGPTNSFEFMPSYSEDGLTFTSPTHLHFLDDLDGDGHNELMGHDGGSDEIVITKTDGGSFSLLSMDVGGTYYRTNQDVEWIAYRLVGGVYVETGRMVLSASDGHIVFTADFLDIDKVVWNSALTFNGSLVVDNIQYVGSEPAIAQNDAFTTSELNAVAGNLFADNGSGADSDPDGPALAISEVNGSAATVGSQITLASGALLTVNADGTFSYDPNGAFQYTPTVGSGASNTPSSDSFTYTLAGGDTATVNLTITGVDNNDTVIGNGNSNVLTGGVGNDSISGLAGDDLIRGRSGDDLIDGGDGFDRAGYYHIDEAAGGVTVDLNILGPQNTGSQGWDTLTSIEYVSGTPFADVLTGDANDNILWGSTATIDPDSNWVSTTNNDTLDGGGGNDLLYVGIGNHSLTGGTGIDTVGFTENFGDDPAIRISLALQGAAQDTGQGLWTLNGIENLTGGNDDDQLTGDGNANILAGSFGNDTLSGGGGNDSLYGDGSIDSGAPASGPPTLFADVGANGNDTLDGGDGDDQLWGGGGSDTASFGSATGNVQAFLYNGGFGEAFGAAGYDQLHDIENLTGSSFNDILYGNNLDNIVIGGAGHDDVRGGAGNDQIYGGAGDDLLYGNAGDDLLDGGAGIDRVGYFSGATAAVTVDLTLQGQAQNTGQGWDTLTGIENVSGTQFGDTLIGDGGDNVLWGSASGNAGGTNNDTLIGNGGNDLLIAGIGNHIIDGGTGIDTFRFSENGGPETGITLSLLLQGAAQDSGNGSWTLNGIENLSGSLAGDTLTGDDNANVLAGNLGNDVLSGGAGNDVLYGDGEINWDTHGTGRSGPITTYTDATSLYVGGVAGNDILEGGLGDDTLNGGGGIDTASYANASGGVTAFLYRLGTGNGESSGADGNDTLVGIENLTGSAFNDALGGNDLANVLTGGDGNDTLRGRGGNDTLLGGNGNDFLNGGLGDDIIDGGAGFDRAAFYNDATTGVTVDLNQQGVAQNTGQGMDTLIGIENVSGSFYADTLIGDAGDNWLWGSGATLDDLSISAANNDTLDGGGGNDLLTVGIGNHTLIGGSGIDTVAFTENGNPETGITVSLALQEAAQVTGNGSWTLTGIENLSGGVANDTLTGDGNANVLAGNVGNDSLIGGAGNDTLYGDGLIETDNRPTGGSGPITTFTDATLLDPAAVDGNDTLEGGLGDDTLNGGGGIDTASYANAAGGVTAFLYTNGNGNGEASGADGNDILVSIENITGSAFNDVLIGNALANVLTGGDGRDELRGRGGNDTLLAGNGNDFLNGGLGDDTIDGGAGFDRAAFYTDATAGVTVNLNLQGVAQNTGQGMDTLANIENVSGTAFGDTLTGDAGDNWLWGSASTLDGIVATTNNDTLIGGGGNDLLTVGIGNHLLDGGTGADTVSLTENGAAENGLTVSLALQGGAQVTGNGSWTLTGIENLSGGIANDTLTGDGNANVLAGNVGNDMLIGGAGNDTLYGDGLIGIDFQGGGGSGPITTYADATLLDPTAIDGNDLLEGGLGDDLINGGGGIDTASYANAAGGVTAVLFTLGNGNGLATGADGNDTLVGIENLVGSAFNDTLAGNALDNVLTGGDGHDIIVGRAGNDTVIGGDGDDYLRGDDGDDMIDGGLGWDRVAYSVALSGVTVDLNIQGVAQNTGQGWDTLISIEHASGSAFNDTIIGNGGDNWLRSWGGDDTITGGDGNDLIETMPGNNILYGGNGVDSWSFYGDGTFILGPVNVSLALQGTAQNTGQGVMLATGFENLSGSIYGDVLAGDGGDNVIAGDVGNDTLSGGAGNDVLYGDGSIFVDWHGNGGSGPITTFADITTVLGGVAGNDVLEGGAGNDVINGGGGIDTASYEHASGAVNVTLFNNLTGNGTATGADGNDSLFSIENIVGSAYNDTLFGSAGNNVLSGGDGNDFLQGRGGDDSLYGGNGNDYVGGGTGNDILDGGAGYDRASFSNGATGPVTVDLRIQGVAQNTGLGMDTLIGIENANGTSFADTFIGNDGDNWLWGGNDAAGAGDTIDGQGGNDLIEDGVGNHNLAGGIGIDTFSFNPFTAPTNATISLALQGAAQDTGAGIMTLTGFENLSGSSFADTLIGDGNANILAGSEGGDSLIGGAGNDTLYGDGVFATDGAPSGPIAFYADVATLGGVDGNDILEGGLGNDTLDGGGGTDTASYVNASGSVTVTLTASGGSSSGADGVDTLVSIESILGGAFNDVLTGNGGDNTLDGGGGHDKLSGGAGNDTLLGNTGDDSLTGGAGDDIYNGGAGFDRANFFGATSGVTVNLTIAGAQNTGQGMDTLVGIENLSGTQFSDTLIGDANNNWLWGFATTAGTVNNDTLDGGGGNDLLWAGNGNMALIGGTGNDTVMYNQNFSGDVAVTISLAVAGAQNTGQGTWTLTGIENLVGGTANDTLTGDGNVNILAGGAGTDTIDGGAGNDTIYGDGEITFDDHGTGGSGPITIVPDAIATYGGVAGNDNLSGGDGDDFIYGGAGNDFIKGDKGNDTLYGGTGNDTLTGGNGIDRYVIEGNSGADTISGFAHLVDKIVFDDSSGVTSYAQLTLTKVGATGTMITWGNGNSIMVTGLKPTDLSVADFQFNPAAAGYEHVNHDFATSYATPHDIFI